MKTTLKTNLLLFMCFISFSNSLMAKDYEMKRMETKSFTVSSNIGLLVDNKYGFINIREWDKNEVKVEATITVTTKKQDRTEEIMKTIHVNYRQSEDLMIWTQYDNIKDCNCSRSVDYQIMVPRNIHYKLKNKYGDITMENASGIVDVDIKYGNFKANNLTGNNNKAIWLEYGNISIDKLNGQNHQIPLIGVKYSDLVSIGSASNIAIDIEYSKLKIENIDSLDIMSSFSDVDIKKVKTLNISQSKYENYKIEEANEITGKKIAYTNLYVGKISNSINISNLSHGELKVEAVEPKFGSISVAASYSPISIRLSPTVSCKLDTYTEFGEIRIKADKLNMTQKIAENTSEKIQCTIGDKPSSLIKITNQYGDIRIYR